MEILEKTLTVIAIILLTAILVTLPVMWLWNWIMPLVFGLIKINFWQALGITLLSNFLFKNANSK